MTAFVDPPRRTFGRRPAPAAATSPLLRALAGRARRRTSTRAVLLDLDGTLVREVPYNSDPDRVEPMPYALEALDLLRAAGIQVAVVANQSGIGRGLLTEREAAAVNARVEQLLGPFDAWALCPHGPLDGCACRKPRPGLVHEAAQRLGLRPEECVVAGDVVGDVLAARKAGARPMMITPRRLGGAGLGPDHWAPDLATAARIILSR